MSRRSSVLAVCVAIALAGCSNLGRPAVSPQPPQVTGVSRSGLELGVALNVDNPNPFPLVANNIQGTLFLADTKEVGTGKATLDQPIEAQSQGTVDSRLDIAWSSMSALREFIGKSEVPYTFKGELGVKGGPLNLSLPFELRGQLSREQLLAIGGSVLSPLLGQ